MRSLIAALLLSTLPSSPNPISAGNVQTEFARGGANPISFSEYYKGGASGYVLTTDAAPNVPTSGAISLGSFYGAARNLGLVMDCVPVAPFGECWNSSPCTATSETTVCTATGGTPPYTWVVTKVSGLMLIYGTGTTGATISRYWAKSNTSPADLFGQWTFRVTDSAAATVVHSVTPELLFSF